MTAAPRYREMLALEPDGERAYEVLTFWFGKAFWSAPSSPANAGTIWDAELWTTKWFAKDEDRAVCNAQLEAFRDLHARARNGELHGWSVSPLGALALIVLLDQFSRNLYDAQAEAWAGDADALQLCLGVLDAHDEVQLPPIGRAQLLMPLVHAEDSTMQQRSVLEYERLARDEAVTCSQRHIFERFERIAYTHAEHVRVFGRFPERNAALGRRSTDGELAFLQTAQQLKPAHLL